jgi:hypothetical protein
MHRSSHRPFGDKRGVVRVIAMAVTQEDRFGFQVDEVLRQHLGCNACRPASSAAGPLRMKLSSMTTRPMIDTTYVVFDAHETMTLSPLTLPLASYGLHVPEDCSPFAFADVPRRSRRFAARSPQHRNLEERLLRIMSATGAGHSCRASIRPHVSS